jgi:hypothetical protein
MIVIYNYYYDYKIYNYVLVELVVFGFCRCFFLKLINLVFLFIVFECREKLFVL